MHKRKQPLNGPSHQILLSIPHVAELLGVGRTTVYSLVQQEGLSGVPAGGRGNLRVHRASLDRWIVERETVA